MTKESILKNISNDAERIKLVCLQLTDEKQDKAILMMRLEDLLNSIRVEYHVLLSGVFDEILKEPKQDEVKAIIEGEDGTVEYRDIIKT